MTRHIRHHEYLRSLTAILLGLALVLASVIGISSSMDPHQRDGQVETQVVSLTAFALGADSHESSTPTPCIVLDQDFPAAPGASGYLARSVQLPIHYANDILALAPKTSPPGGHPA